MIGTFDRKKLARLLGQFGGANDNEVLIAARKAHAMVRAADLTWEDALLNGPPALPLMPDHQGLLISCLAHPHLLTDWEENFLQSLRHQRYPFTPKQCARLERIAAKIDWRAA
jgi:hypothetical protein